MERGQRMPWSCLSGWSGSMLGSPVPPVHSQVPLGAFITATHPPHLSSVQCCVLGCSSLAAPLASGW